MPNPVGRPRQSDETLRRRGTYRPSRSRARTDNGLCLMFNEKLAKAQRLMGHEPDFISAYTELMQRMDLILPHAGPTPADERHGCPPQEQWEILVDLEDTADHLMEYYECPDQVMEALCFNFAYLCWFILEQERRRNGDIPEPDLPPEVAKHMLCNSPDCTICNWNTELGDEEPCPSVVPIKFHPAHSLCVPRLTFH